MTKSLILASLFSLMIAAEAAPAKNEIKETKDCPPKPQHMRISARHIEAGGIGYDKGYTTLELFLATDPNDYIVMPFLDIRGHVFNNGQGAFNGGIGARGTYGGRAYGGNIYYDFRNTSKKFYNQMGLGLETLGSLWDVRVNGYIPVGGKVSAPYDLGFDSFSGNSILVNRKYQYAMGGVDAEAGFHFGKTTDFDFYAAAGPYYFKGTMGDGAVGGKGRIAGYYKEYVTLEFSDSYDSVFHNHFQGQLTLSLPLGPKSKTRLDKKQRIDTCAAASTLDRRMVQPVARQEIVVIDTHKKIAAADQRVLFVNNLSHSAGTYESPYPTLADAIAASNEGDIIYVYPGDGTSNGLNGGTTPFTLKNSQQLLGSSIPQTVNTNLGTVTIPPEGTLLPYLTADANTNVIDIGNGNVISGFHIVVPGGGSNWAVGTSNSFSGLTVANNLMQGQNSDVILLDLGDGEGFPSGTVNVTNNQFRTGNTASHAIYGVHDSSDFLLFNLANNTFSGFGETCVFLSSNQGIITANVTGNEFYNASINNYALAFSAQAEALFQINIANNSFVTDFGIYLELYDNGQIDCTLADNNIYVNAQILYMYQNHDALLSVTARNNHFKSDGDRKETIFLEAFSDSKTTLFFVNNKIDVSGFDQSAIGFRLSSADASTVDFNSINNQITCAGYLEPYSIYLSSSDTSLLTANVENCILEALDAHIEGYGIYVDATGSSTVHLAARENEISASNYGVNIQTSTNASVQAAVENNLIGLTRSGQYCIGVATNGASSCNLVCNSNFMSGPQGIEFISGSTNPLTGVFANNTIEGQSTQRIVNVTNSSTGTISATMNSNSIYGNAATGDYVIGITSSGGGKIGFDFENNSMVSGGIGLLGTSQGTGSEITAHVISNNLQTLSGDQFIAQTDSPNICLRYVNNMANGENTFTNSGSGTFTLYYEGNNQPYTETGVVIGDSASCPLP